MQWRPCRVHSQLQSRHICFHTAPTDVTATAFFAMPLSTEPCAKD